MRLALALLLLLQLGPERPIAPLIVGTPPADDFLLDVVKAGDGWLMFILDGRGTTAVRVDATGNAHFEDAKRVTGDGYTAIASTDRSLLAVGMRSGDVFIYPLNADGTRRDPFGRLLATRAEAPLLACGPSRCMAVVRSLQKGGARGMILDEEGQVVAEAVLPADGVFYAAAADPGGFLVLTRDHAIRVGVDGRIAFDVAIPAATTALDFDGEAYALVRASEGKLLATRVRLDSTVEEERTIFDPPAATYSSLELAWNGREHVLAFGFFPSTSVPPPSFPPTTDVLAVRLSRDLAPLREAGPVDLDPLWNWRGHVAANGESFFLAWHHTNERHEQNVRGARLGSPDSVATRRPMDQRNGTLAITSSGPAAIWTEIDAERSMQTLRFAVADGAPLRSSVIVERFSLEPHAAAIGNDVLVAWAGKRWLADPPVVSAAIVNAVDRTVTPVSVGMLSDHPRVAASATRFAIFASQGAVLRASILSRGGVLLTPEPATIAPEAVQWVAASDGEQFLVVWWGYLEAGATLLDADGRVIRTSPLPRGVNPAVAWNGREYLAASTAWLARIGRDGRIMATAPAPHELAFAHIAPFGGDWLLQWETVRNGTFLARLSADLQPIEPMAINTGDHIVDLQPAAGGALALVSRLIEVPPYPPVPALALREVIERAETPRRRAR